MDNLINFSTDDCFKVASPLIPLPVDPQQKYKPRLSDVDNNPFDKVLRKSMRDNDPFDCVFEESFKNCINTSAENKENVHLISPFMTPVVNKKKLKICTTPIYIVENEPNTPTLRTGYEHLIPKDSRRNSLDDPNNSSLQFLNDSVFNDTLNYGFVNTNELSENTNKTNNSLIIPDICLNNIEIKNNNRPKSILSPNSENIISFNSDSLNSCDISQIPSKPFPEDPNLKKPSFGDSLTFNEISNIATLDRVFITESLASEKSMDFRRRCMSASRPVTNDFLFKSISVKRQLNNSFAGFQFDDKENSFEEKEFFKHDLVLLEEQKMKKKGDASLIQQALDAKDKLDASNPPWIDENLVLPSDTSDIEDDFSDKTNLNSDSKGQLKQTNLKEHFEESCVENYPSENDINKNEIKMNENDVKAKDLLQNITDTLSSVTNSVERKKLGESLLNTLTLALNFDNSLSLNDQNENKVREEEKKAKPLKPKNKLSFKNLDTKIKAQAMKITEKSLKVKSDKEKHVKGPLKAVIPVKNMAKSKKSIVPKFSFGSSSCTPPKILKTSTPNERKLKSPVAQSTPNISKSSYQSATTPTRCLSYLRSSLPRPSSTNDLNKSISPKNLGNTSSSCHNLGSSQYNPDKSAQRSIPLPGNCSMLRRKSASDLKDTNLQRSFDVAKVSKPSKLKRSSSFQNKYLKT